MGRLWGGLAEVGGEEGGGGEGRREEGGGRGGTLVCVASFGGMGIVEVGIVMTLSEGDGV